MKRANNSSSNTCLFVLALLVICQPAHANDLEQAERDFTIRVLPLLQEKCLGCHGGDAQEIKGEYSIVDREHLLLGGESGEEAIVPGETAQGSLLSAIRWDSIEMPPKENDRLTASQIAIVERWIKAGAPWPDETRQKELRLEELAREVTDEGRIMHTSGGTSEAWTNRRYAEEDLWAFQPLKKLVLDKSQIASNAKSDEIIDALINQKLQENNISAATRADARTLIRRATFDLHGLPPTPHEINAFVADTEQDANAAWIALIDRLLASPRYGERWGRNWLDVTRYADTGGMSNDYERSNMWRYRDYVIRAFNEDKPYNEFIVEQIAGDELADQSVLQRFGGDQAAVIATQQNGQYNQQEAEWIIASGFLRLGPWDNAMIEADEARQLWLDDVVNITGQTFLSTTMRCFKCHDHKFDPLPTRDYYRMYATFSTTHMAERAVPYLSDENKAGFESGQAHAQRMLDFAEAERNKLVDKRESAAHQWFAEHKLPYKDEAARKDLLDEEKPPRSVGLDHVDEGQLKVREQDVWIWTRQLERYEPMAQSVYNAPAADLAWNGARKLRVSRSKKANQPPENFILTGGALTAHGDPVQPGVLSAIGLGADDSIEDDYLLTDEVEGRRLGLARWIANPDNVLATRSIANRIWQGHFGVGIAANSNNFGAKGSKPTHPELLDFLAADFVENGWKIKRLHKLMMLSDAYRRSSNVPDDDGWKTADPDNRWLSHFPRRRMGAEEIRDGILQITGELQQRDGGLPIMPEINMEVALQPRMIQFSLAPAYQPSATPEQRNQRTIYAYHVRGQSDPFTELFNQPNPNDSCELRESAAVTPQVFTLLNSDQITDRSIAFALRLQNETAEPVVEIGRAFELAFGRQASQQEIVRLEKYYREMMDYHRQTPVQPITYPTEITRSLVEEFSGNVFEYTEILPVFENYIADKKAADVSAETRALADVCLLLLNANEFMYVN